MSTITYVVPGPLGARTGGSIYNRRMIDGLRARGWSIALRELEGGYPVPSAADLKSAAAVLQSLPDGSLVVADGLAFGAMAEVVVAERHRLRLVPVVHLPLADEVGVEPETARERADGERRALAAAAIVIVTGDTTAATVRAYGIDPERIRVVHPGTDRSPLAVGHGGNTVGLLCVAAITAGKGHDVLVRALDANRDFPWRMTCAGSATRSPQTAARVRSAIHEAGLAGRIEFVGEADERALSALYARADLFVLPTRRETFGMAVAEAIGHGIPVVSTATGDIPALVAGAGLIVPPGDQNAFTAALRAVLADPCRRAVLREAAVRARDRLVSWDQAAGILANALTDVDRVAQ